MVRGSAAEHACPSSSSTGGAKASRSILHVTECYSSGAARAIDTIVQLSPQHQHHLLWAGEDEPYDGFHTVTRLPRGVAARIGAVVRTARRIGADVVHAHSSWAGLYARAFGPSTRTIYQPHGYKLCDPHLSWPERRAFTLAETVLGRHTHQVVILSPEEDRIAAKLTPHTPRVFLPNAPALAAAMPRVESGGGRERVVVMAGRVCAQKDPAFFAATANEIRRRDRSVTFRWLGGADDRAGVRQLRAAGVDITGWLTTPQLADVLSRAGVYVHSAIYEGFPISLLDALWCGTPAIVRPIPALSGVALAKVSTPREAADLALALLDDERQRADAQRVGESVLAVMSTERQRTAITRIYR